jgi:hypothetical protein
LKKGKKITGFGKQEVGLIEISGTRRQFIAQWELMAPDHRSGPHGDIVVVTKATLSALWFLGEDYDVIPNEIPPTP